jgi:heme/copper-type cytochrome/quinol oxidase subunit 1
MPRRHYSYPPEFQTLNIMSTAGATILAVGYLLPLAYLTWSMRYGAMAGPNPWPATGLEWQTTSPPPEENFHVTPEVTWEPYDFGDRSDLGLETGAVPSLAPHTEPTETPSAGIDFWLTICPSPTFFASADSKGLR